MLCELSAVHYILCVNIIENILLGLEIKDERSDWGRLQSRSTASIDPMFALIPLIFNCVMLCTQPLYGEEPYLHCSTHM